MINSASIVNCSFLTLREETRQIVDGGAKFFHIDLMDGHYVPNLCMPVKFVQELAKEYPQIVMDVHLMVTDPSAYVQRLADAGAGYFSFHADSTPFCRRVLAQAHKAGMKAGVVINPSQRLDCIEPYIQDLDMVTLMAVEPGFSGQPLLPGSMERLEELAKLRKTHGAHYLINVDGGISLELESRCAQIGVDVIIGTVHNIFRQPEGLQKACERFERQWG